MVAATQAELAEGDMLWDKGDKAGGVAKYRSILNADRINVLKEVDRPRLYGRLIDHEYENGNIEAGKALLEKAVGNNVVPAVNHESAKAQIAAEKLANAQAAELKNPARFNFTLAQQVEYIVSNDFGLTREEADAVLQPGKEVGGLAYTEDDKEFDPKSGKMVIVKMRKGTIRKGKDTLKKLRVGPLNTDRGDPKVDNSQPRIHSIEAVVRDGAEYHTKIQWSFHSFGGSGEPIRILRHPDSITEYDGTRWKVYKKLTSYYLTGQKAYECYGIVNAGYIDPCCFDERNRFWDRSGKEIDQNTYCVAGLGDNWRENFFKGEAQAGRQNVERLLESMKRNGAMTDNEAQKIIRNMEQAGTIPRK